MKHNKATVMGLMSAAALALGAQQAGAVTNDVYNGIGGDTTWYSNDVYRLMEPVFVTNGATLTIQAGTVIRGKNNGAGVAPGALIVSRGAKIAAMGTAQLPIVFTCEADDNVGANPGTGDWANKNNEIDKQWGGLILLGKTYIATDIGGAGNPSPNAGLELQIEGITSYGEISKYGGGDDNDNSGEIHYVQLRYGGFVLGANNEINGLTLGAVGRGTKIDHVEVFHNADDDVEFFGGTVNTKYIVAWSSMDDGMDIDEGYRGKQQFMLRVKGALGPTSERSDKGSEEDGGMGALSQPSSCPVWYNWTQIGLGKASGQKRDTGFMLRDGTGCRSYNSLWMDFGGAPALIEGSPANGTAGEAGDKFVSNYVANAYYQAEAVGLDGVQAKMGEMKYNLYWKFGTNAIPGFTAGAADNYCSTWGSDNHTGPATNRDWYGYAIFTDASLKNIYLDEATYACPVSNLTRRSTATSIGDGKSYYNVDVLDPRPAPAYADPMMTLGRVPPNDGFFTPVNFVGAFGKTKNWALGWTLASRFGLLTGGTQGDYTGVVPSIRNSSGNVQVSLSTDIYAGLKADYYVIINVGAAWYRYDLSKGWVALDLAKPVPTVLNAVMGDIPWTTVIAVSSLPAGSTYNFYFVIDTVPGNGKLDMDKLYVGSLAVPR